MTENGEIKEFDEPSDQPYRSIGGRLREAREAEGLSVNEVSLKLKLAGILVEDLEQGRGDRMAALYRRGYLRNYARLLGLDADRMLAELEPERPPELKAVMPAGKRIINLDRWLKIATYVVVTIAIVPPLVIFYVQSGSRIAERDVSVTEQSLDVDQDASPSEERVAQRISRALALDEPADEAAGDEPGHMSASALPLGAIRSVREATPDSDEGPTVTPETLPEEAPAMLSPPGLDLQVDVRGDSWVEIVASDGERLEYDLLRSGQSRRYSGQPPFRILLGRAGSVDLMVDGRLVEYSGHDNGGVVELELLANGDARL